MQPDSIAHALQAAVSPVILISAYGLLLLSMTNRLGRAIDRARKLVREPTSTSLLQIEIIMQRARWIRSSILFTAIAITAAALLVLVLFLAAFLSLNVWVIVPVLFVASLVSLVVSLCYFIVELFRSLSALDAEVDSARKAR
ncbi:MAG TPA: DUF2721 domain-containing protein [Opitutaceae bacterium]|nr:DUF2721 domain-containing protein [Opitutaceae bacterium]